MSSIVVEVDCSGAAGDILKFSKTYIQQNISININILGE